MPCPVRGAAGAPPTPIALAEIPAIGRTLPSLPQAGVQAHLALHLDGVATPDVAAWAVANVACDATRRARVEALGRAALPLATPGHERVARLGSVFGRSVA